MPQPARVLVDSNFLYACFTPKDVKYPEAAFFARTYRGQMIVPDVVLTEVAFLYNRQGGIRAVTQFLDLIRSIQPTFEPISMDDLNRVRQIMQTYHHAQLDFVDCCIMALAERLNITQICTFDYRDFSIFRPRHCAYFELFP